MRSFLDEAPTFDDEVPTCLHGSRPDRTLLELGEPEPTQPPEPMEAVLRARPAARPAKAPSTPSALERYKFERVLGQGTFGRVVAARDTKLGRTVALKLLHVEHVNNPELRQRFLQEAHAAACIAHPGIVTVFDMGDGDAPFIAMELLAGESLQARITRLGKLPPAQARELARQVASALDAAHRAGVIHRDLKPENILLVPDPAAVGGERVKVLDFGLAKPTLSASVKTRAATVFGTPLYMAPEQFDPNDTPDSRCDIYALGCVLFLMLAGRLPFEGTMREIATMHRCATPPAVRDFAPEVPEELDLLVRKMLAKERGARPQTMAEIERALRPEAARPVTPAVPAAPARRRGFWLPHAVAAAAIAAAAVLAALS